MSNAVHRRQSSASPKQGRRRLGTIAIAGTMGAAFTMAALSGGAEGTSAGPAKKVPDLFQQEPAEGYVSTLLDGAGGVAGVPLTREQRTAVVAEMQRRGYSAEEAYGVAYGDDVALSVAEDGTVKVDTSGVVMPNGPVYRRAEGPGGGGGVKRGSEQPSSAATSPQSDSRRDAASSGDADREKDRPVTKKPSSSAGDEKKHGGRRDAERKGPEVPGGHARYYENSGKNPYEKGPEDVVRDALRPVTDWMGALGGRPEAGPRVEVRSAGPTRTLFMATSQVGQRAEVSVAVEVDTPKGQTLAVRPDPVVSVKIVDTRSAETLAESRPTPVKELVDVRRVAMGEVAEAVVDAAAKGLLAQREDRPALPSQERADEAVDGVPEGRVVASFESVEVLGAHVEQGEAA
ncbi:hypothetical protein ACH5AU_23780 [Streptomyces albidoflavus]